MTTAKPGPLSPVELGPEARRFFTRAAESLAEGFLRDLASDNPFQKTTFDSREIYQAYGERDLRDYEAGSTQVLDRGHLRSLPYREVRARYLEALCTELEPLLAGGPLRVLEVGCGNALNLVGLRQRFGEQLTLAGLDISPERLRVARGALGAELEGVELHAGSITEPLQGLVDDAFDLVFSVHCLEQIPYRCEPALRQIDRLAARKVVLIEPVFELGNLAQRLYLYRNDHNRILLRTIRELGYALVRLERLSICVNPLNPSGVIVWRPGGRSG